MTTEAAPEVDAPPGPDGTPRGRAAQRSRGNPLGRAGAMVLAMFGLDGHDRWRWIRLGLFAVYGVALAVWQVVVGIHDGWITVATIIVLGLAITRVGRDWRAVVQVVADWLPFTLVLMAYDWTRGLADGIGISLHMADVAHAEAWLFNGVQPAVWLQAHLYDARHPNRVHWYDAACTLVYTSHFLSTPVVAAVLWLRDRALWLKFISRVILLAAAGLVTYTLFPEAPPWYASQHHVIGPVARLSTRGWIWLDAGDVNTAFAHVQSAGSNPVAAMPSLHTAFATIIALFLAGRFRSRWRWLFALYPLAMAFTLVYCGEHYVLDVVAGVLYALVVDAVVSGWERRRAAASGTDPDADPDGAPDAAAAHLTDLRHSR